MSRREIKLNLEALEPAGNAVGSCTATDFDQYMRKSQDWYRQFWQGVIFQEILKHSLTLATTFSFLDIGSGSGVYTTRIAQEAIKHHLETKVTAIDLVPENTTKTKTRLAETSASATCYTGDITKFFPKGVYDLISLIEIIHWLSPNDTAKILCDAKNNLADGALIVASFATVLNAALLADPHGDYDIRRATTDENRPIYAYSNSCKTMMSFWGEGSLRQLADSIGLEVVFYAEIPNPNFPTLPYITLPEKLKHEVSQESASIAFRKL